MGIFSLISLFFAAVLLCGCHTREINHLRVARHYGPIGRFPVPRDSLEEVFRGLNLEGMVELKLSTSEYGCEFGELSIGVQTFENLPVEQNDPMLQPSTVLFVGLPIVSKDGNHSLVILTSFTDSTTPYGIPFLTNVDSIHFIESIEFGDKYITLRDCNASMNITYQRDDSCDNDQDISEDFNDVYGQDVRISNYPAPFNWGCDALGDAFSFCRTLTPFKEEIADADGNYCTVASAFQSERCQADMEITSMTGTFRSDIPLLAGSIPLESLETEWLDRVHDIGILYPCF